MSNALIVRTMDGALQAKYEFWMANQKFPDAFLFEERDFVQVRMDPRAVQFINFNPAPDKGWTLDGTPIYVRY